MSRSIEGVSNWMHMFRWIVKLIRDEYGVDEKILTRTAALETDCGLSIEQVEEVLEIISESFEVRFPNGTLDEVLKLEELCMLAAWLRGLFKKPEFLSADFEDRCRSMNALAGA
ncbi:acyl carrier protein [Niveispirillum sp. SYP-B3756]|uniref:acyl carrier protein n=1 Tax=Niveispirillum sp. SYP-B3756 TaxID=2662178 RepID=UPI0012909CBA|nr:acyl carrier protein [Niveispirillum sp. SYP-B3756]MQP67601.1 acyl carrier protein [Niveispirillum sp. SYP-B3756]